MKWRVYYANHTTFDGAPDQAWPLGVIGIVHQDAETGRSICHGKDYYIYLEAEDRWETVDIFGLWDYLCQSGWKRVLFGRTIPNREYARLLAQMLADPDFPPKTAWHGEERQ